MIITLNQGEMKFGVRLTLFYLLILIYLSDLCAQTIIQGQVIDEKSAKPLAAANIQVKNTYRGTISNQDGFFLLSLDSLPASIVFSYIGYESKNIQIVNKPATDLLVKLKPVILEMEPITVIAEDPAMSIMRKVIERKQLWYPDLQTYRADAYSRLTLENDSGIVSISESLSELFWDHELGTREVIKSKRQTNNMSEQQNIAVASFIPNFYDDDIEIIGYSVPGPTHPDAFDFYRFRLMKTRNIDNKIVYDIEVIPDSKLQPAFSGELSVLDEKFSILRVDLVPGESIRFPTPIQELNLHFLQQFREFASEFWLPLDFRVSGDIKIGIIGLQFPKINYNRIATLSDYAINIDLPDSLYQSDKLISVDSLSLESETLFETAKLKIPLTIREDSAYNKLDSSMTLEKAFKPSGFLADLVEMTGDQADNEDENDNYFFSYFTPQLWYNRVDGLHSGLVFKLDLLKNIQIRFGAAYKTGQKRWSLNTMLMYNPRQKSGIFVQLCFDRETRTRFDSESYSLTVSSLPALFGRPDYFDFYWIEGISSEIGYHFESINTLFSLRFISHDNRSLTKSTDFNLLGSNYVQRKNPDIEEGTMRSLGLNLQVGPDYIPFGLVGQKRAALQIEISEPSFLPSNYKFTRYLIDIDWRFKTFLTRRFLPNVLDLHLSAGHSTGRLPIQRFAIIDGSLGLFTPFATLKTRRNRPFEGESHLVIYWEHNFRTVPFELLNLSLAVENGIGVIIFGAHGRTWINNKRFQYSVFQPERLDEFYHEFGFSINNLFSLLRIDMTYRLISRSIYAGLSFSRFF